MRGVGGFGGGFGGMLGGQRGLQSGGFNSPTMDNLTDEGVVGSAYDHKVVMRLSTYVKPYKKDAILSLLAIIVYTAANVAIPLMLMLGINRYINTGNSGGLHLLAVGFLIVILIHFVSNYLQFIFMPRVGQGILYTLRTQMFNHLQTLSPSFFHRTPVGRIMSRSQSDVLQLQELFDGPKLCRRSQLGGNHHRHVGDRLAACSLHNVCYAYPVPGVSLLAKVRPAFFHADPAGDCYG